MATWRPDDLIPLARTAMPAPQENLAYVAV